MNNIEQIRRARQGDPDAFADLFRLYAKDMYRVAYAILMNNEDAADAIQDTILTCWKKLNTLREEAFFKTWMTRILINHCYRIREKNQKVISMDSYVGQGEAEASSSNREFHEMLSVLSDDYRLLMILYYEEGYKIREIAELLQMSESTVQTKLKRGRDRLARQLKAENQ